VCIRCSNGSKKTIHNDYAPFPFPSPSQSHSIRIPFPFQSHACNRSFPDSDDDGLPYKHLRWPLLIRLHIRAPQQRHLLSHGYLSWLSLTAISELCLTHSLRLPTFCLMLHVGKMLSICSRSSLCQPSIFFPLVSDSQSFGAVINDAFLEPSMFERLLSRNALLRIVYKDLSEEIEQLLVERPIVGNKFLLPHISGASTSPINPATYRKTLHRFDILPRCPSRV